MKILFLGKKAGIENTDKNKLTTLKVTISEIANQLKLNKNFVS